MVEDLIKRLRDDAGLDGQKLLAADLLEQQAARIAELTTCKLCNSTGNSTPCAYPTEINRQQARRLTALESERDALLAAAGKQAVAWLCEPNGWNGFPQLEFTTEHLSSERWKKTPLYTSPTAALEKGDGRDAERYRWLRRGQTFSVVDCIGNDLRADDLDTAIDAALARKAGEQQ
jgi:hypothetical protein